MTNVKQPILILQGELDKQVLPHHADKLAELARGRKKAAPVEVIQLPGLNHLFVPAQRPATSPSMPSLETKVDQPRSRRARSAHGSPRVPR